MSKLLMKPGTMVYPVPAVMVTCGDQPDNYNIITIAWTGTINSMPPMTYVSVRKERHSHAIISENQEFVINLTSEDLVKATDFCGVRSGKDINKFEHLKLTPIPGEHVKAPLIKECPVNIECKVKQVLELGSHDMFIAEVVAVHVNEELMDKDGKLHLEWSKPVCYSHGEYYKLGETVGKFGYSVMRPKTAKQYEKEKAVESRNKEKTEIRERKKTEKEQARLDWEKSQKEWYEQKNAKANKPAGRYNSDKPRYGSDDKPRYNSDKPRYGSDDKPRYNSDKPRYNSDKPRTESKPATAGKSEPKKFDKYADKAKKNSYGNHGSHEKGIGHEKRTTGSSNRGTKKVFNKKGV